MPGKYIGQHVDNTPAVNNGQRSRSPAANVGQPTNRTPAQVGQLSGGEIQQGRAVPKPDISADLNGGDSSEGGYGSQNVKDD